MMGNIEIPDDTVISSGAFILFPTKLDKRTLVSAGSIVRGDYNKPYVLVGNPARPSISSSTKGK